MSKDKASTMVVMNGDAMTAGSKPSFFANKGSVHPTNLAIMMVNTNEIDTTAAIIKETLVFPIRSLSTSIIFANLEFITCRKGIA